MKPYRRPEEEQAFFISDIVAEEHFDYEVTKGRQAHERAHRR